MKFSALHKLSKPIYTKNVLRTFVTKKQPSKCAEKVLPIPTRYRERLFDTFFWDEFRDFADRSGAINLGEEARWCNGCEYTRKQLQKFATKPNFLSVQYTRSAGHPRLCNAVAAYYDRHMKLNLSNQQSMKKIDPMNEIIITNGIQEAIYIGLMSIIDEGDEIVIFEPYKTCFVQVATEAGAKIRYVPLKPYKYSCTANDWKFDERTLKKSIGPKTKMVIINSPQFPLGKNWTQDELELLLCYLQKYNVMVLCDATQDYLNCDPGQHIHLCTQKGFWERTLTILDISDMFGLPGWNVACLYGPSYFIAQAQIVHQDLIYTSPTQVQEALAVGLEREVNNQKEECTFSSSLVRGLEPRKKILYEIFKDIGFLPVWPESGYWMMTNWRPVSGNCDVCRYKDEYEDFKFNKWLSDHMKFQGIPVTPFYSDKHKHYGEEYIAFCFLNDLQKIYEVIKILASKLHKQV